MQIARQNLPDGTIKLTVTIPQKRVEEIREQELTAILEGVEVPGFRKGKAPKKLAEEKVDKEKLLQRVINRLIPETYQEAIKKESLRPIVLPKIRLISAQENQNWQIEIQTCEAPEVKLGNYKEEIKKINAAGKIWTPGTTETKKKKGDVETKEERLQKILDILLSHEAEQLISAPKGRDLASGGKVEIPALLIENELNRRLAALINKTEKLGITLEQYLTSIGQTIEILKENYKKASESFWKLELILNKITDEEKIAVEQEEIEKLINQGKDEKEKQALAAQRYFLAQMLRRQKTLDFLLGL